MKPVRPVERMDAESNEVAGYFGGGGARIWPRKGPHTDADMSTLEDGRSQRSGRHRAGAQAWATLGDGLTRTHIGHSAP